MKNSRSKIELSQKKIDIYELPSICKNSDIVLVKKIAFFWVGQKLEMVENFISSIRSQYQSDCKIIQITDRLTELFDDVDECIRFDAPQEMMLARMQGYNLVNSVGEYVAFYDTDTLFLDKIRIPKVEGINHFLVARSKDFVMNHNQSNLEFYPEFVNKNVKDIMLFIGGCIITNSPNELFSNLLNIYSLLPPRMHRWYGDQVALHEFGVSNAKNLMILSEENYLKTFGQNLSHEMFDYFKSKNVLNIHFKGKSSKKYFSSCAKFIDNQRSC